MIRSTKKNSRNKIAIVFLWKGKFMLAVHFQWTSKIINQLLTSEQLTTA